MYSIYYLGLSGERSLPFGLLVLNIPAYQICTWLKFAISMDKSIPENLSKFHYHNLTLTFSIVRLYEGIITFEPRHEKTNVLVSDLVRHKLGCTATKDG